VEILGLGRAGIELNLDVDFQLFFLSALGMEDRVSEKRKFKMIH
jgi:hypothetical protein